MYNYNLPLMYKERRPCRRPKQMPRPFDPRWAAHPRLPALPAPCFARWQTREDPGRGKVPAGKAAEEA